MFAKFIVNKKLWKVLNIKIIDKFSDVLALFCQRDDLGKGVSDVNRLLQN